MPFSEYENGMSKCYPLRYDLYTCTVNNHSFVDLDQLVPNDLYVFVE